MKRVLMLLLILTTICFGQYNIGKANRLSNTTTVTIDSTSIKTLYVLFPSDNIGTIMTTSSSVANGFGRPNLTWTEYNAYITMELDSTGSVGGSTADSLSLWIKPLVWDYDSEAYAVITIDSLNLVFDTAGTYTSASKDILDWTTDTTYGCKLTSLWNVAGFVMYLYTENSVSGTAQITVGTVQEF